MSDQIIKKTGTYNEVIDLSPPKEWLYKCDCPKCLSGMHYDKEIAESYRKRGELNNEVARLREELKERIETQSTFALAREASRASDIHNHVLIVDCLRYLLDEIQKLTEGK